MGGFGLKVSRFHVDYAFQSWSENGTLHYLGLRISLSSFPVVVLLIPASASSARAI